MAIAEARPSIVFGGRELWPFVTGGGIASTIHASLRLLAAEMDVTMITREAFREQYEEMRASADPRLPHPDVRFEFIEDPVGFDLGPFSSFHHCWSARVYERLCRLYPDGGPAVAVFGDYLGEGFVTAQARRSGHPSLRRTTVMVRLHTSLEMVDALDGREVADAQRRAIYTLERGSIAFADVLGAPAEPVYPAYQRFYGADNVAPGAALPNLIANLGRAELARTPAPPGGPTRILFIGRLQFLKGVVELVEAATRLARDDWELTLLGGDTNTAPGGGSMRQHLERIAGGNERIVFHDRVPLERVYELIDQHHVVVAPSHWECWSAVAREALSRNRPVLAAPRGGLIETVKPGVSGWLTGGTSTEDIERGLRLVLDSRAEIDAMIDAEGPAARLDELTAPEVALAHYRELASRTHEPSGAAASDETVSAVVVCSSGGSVSKTLDSISVQLDPVDEVVLACDGIERLPVGFDTRAIDVLVPLPAGSGSHACRNAGCEAAKGSLVLLLDAGMELDPRVVGRLRDALRRNPSDSYATAWAHGLDPSAVPLGNFANLVPEYDNSAVAPLVRRAVFESGHRFEPGLGPCASRAFYAGLADAGLFGCVVPERLVSWAPFSAACADPSAMSRADGTRPERFDWMVTAP
jgi:glycogen synthase